MRGYDRDELHGGIEDYDEYEEEGEELEEDDGEGPGEEEGYEEEEEENPKPTKEELDYLSLRQRLKEQIRKQMKKETGSSLNSSNERKKKLPYDNYGSFFGTSQPVIAQRVIQESKSLLETQHLPSRLPNSLHGNKKNSSTSRESRPESRPGSRGQLPKVRSELKTKVQKLKDTRDYSFLLSEDAELPAPAKEPRPRNVSFPNSEARSTQVPLKSKQPLGNSGKHLHGTHEERKTVSVNGKLHSKTGSNKLTSANKPNLTSVDPRKQLGSNIGNGPGRPIVPKGLPLKKHVATMEKKALAPGAKNSIPGVQKPPTSKLQSSVPKQRLEQKKGLEEPKKSKMMPKQHMSSSKPQINKPHKQVPSHPTSQDHRPKKKPLARYSDDEDGEGVKAISMIRQMFRYNPNRYDDYGDDSDMEANFEDIMKEERRSAKIARKEDEEQLRMIEEEEERERLRKLKKRKLGH